MIYGYKFGYSELGFLICRRMVLGIVSLQFQFFFQVHRTFSLFIYRFSRTLVISSYCIRISSRVILRVFLLLPQCSLKVQRLFQLFSTSLLYLFQLILLESCYFLFSNNFNMCRAFSRSSGGMACKMFSNLVGLFSISLAFVVTVKIHDTLYIY